jgi:hypothetical protein
MNIIEKTQIHNYEDNTTKEYIAKGGYLISDLVDYKEIEMHGGGVGANAVRDFFSDLAIPTGLYVRNIPTTVGGKHKVLPRAELMDDNEFNRLIDGVSTSKSRGGKTHKKTQIKPKSIRTRKNTL